MSDSRTGSTPWDAVRRHVALCAVLVIACIATSLVLAAIRPVMFLAEARLSVGGASLAARAVPGFTLASHQLASDYARYINSGESQQSLETTIGENSDAVGEVIASPIPESNVVRIEVWATEPDIAVSVARALAESLVDQVKDSSAEDEVARDALRRYAELSAQVAETEQALDVAQAGLAATQNPADLPAARTLVATTATQLDILHVQQQAAGERYRALIGETPGTASDLTIVQDAAPVGDDRLATFQLHGVAGLFAGLGLATLAAVAIERRKRRRAARVARTDPAPTSDRTPAPRGERAVTADRPLATANDRTR